jgi:hypothetical protein
MSFGVPWNTGNLLTSLATVSFTRTSMFLGAVCWEQTCKKCKFWCCEEFCLLGYNATYSTESQPAQRREISSPYSGLVRNPKKTPARSRTLLVAYLILVSCLAYSSILKMEATYPSETSVYFQRTTRRYNPQYRNHLPSQIPHDMTWDRTQSPRWETKN